MAKPVITESELYALQKAIMTYLHDSYGTIEEWKESCKVINKYFEVKRGRRSK